MNADKRIPELDGLRGCAILLVTVWHSVMLIDPTKGAISDLIWRFSIFGQSGVDLFFVLSGFLIVGILSDHRESGSYFSTFYARRALRILPPYLILILGFYLLTRTFGSSYYLGSQVPVWALLTFIQNWFFVSTQGAEAATITGTWSLAIEEQFYLVIPLLVWCVPRRHLLSILLAIGLASASTRAFYFWANPSDLYGPYVMTPLRLDGLAIGAAIAVAYRSDAVRVRIFAQIKAIRWTCVLLASVAPFYAWSLRSATGHQVLYYVGHLYLASMYGLILILATQPGDGRTKSLLRSRVLGFFGMISYSLYLFHTPAKGVVFYLFRGSVERLQTVSDAMLMIVSTAVAILFCLALHRFVEGPAQLRGKTFHYDSNPQDSNLVAIERR
ncbi:acyltransferase [Bradyrhizobium jicamae]|uniref:Acyltransferase n=1 Tax=Bradyrhizobium jicamae TaxID=280332 RepID=A0ABS5FUI0_9BRAD|nr:acyltransferase [Bradyrhizobium jicamae]MBR0800482.1 acyltransferase [Bradyrhizobium jicamae]